MNIKNRIKVGLIVVLGVAIAFTGCKKEEEVFTPGVNTVSDRDGNVYHTVKIGDQVWMVENLKTTKYNDGTAITDGNAPGFVATTPAYCHYGGGGANTATYGLMYNGYAVATGKLAPVGWHVATNADWMPSLRNSLMLRSLNSNRRSWRSNN